MFSILAVAVASAWYLAAEGMALPVAAISGMTASLVGPLLAGSLVGRLGLPHLFGPYRGAFMLAVSLGAALVATLLLAQLA